LNNSPVQRLLVWATVSMAAVKDRAAEDVFENDRALLRNPLPAAPIPQ
jgi:hypothetical protein